MIFFGNKKELGKKGEELAAREIKQLGWRIIDKNYRTIKGEIDLVAFDGNEIVFIEVKTRRFSAVAIDPIVNITLKKRKTLELLAEEYLYKNKREEQPRFDVVTILIKSSGDYIFEHYRNAF